MDKGLVRRVHESYNDAARACSIQSRRISPWQTSHDALLLNNILPKINKENDRVLDFGCSGCPWTSNFLINEGYDVVAADIEKNQWHDNNLIKKLGIPMVEYDGQNIPFKDGSFDVILMFGVLEHIGVRKGDGTKHPKLTPQITEKRRQIIKETNRILSSDGLLYITRYPNYHCRNAIISKLLGRRVGHLDSERARPDYLHQLLEGYFQIEDMSTGIVLPHSMTITRLGLGIPTLYTKIDDKVADFPGIRKIAQSYTVVANVA